MRLSENTFVYTV